ARHAHNPAARHWKAVWKMISYLKATKDLGVVFRRGGDLKLSLFADEDYVSRYNDKRSISGVAVMLGNTAVRASSTTQHCVTLSTREAEYATIAHVVKTVLAEKAVLDFAQPHLSGRAIDATSEAIKLANNPLSSKRTRHIDIKHHFIRDAVLVERVRVVYVASEDQHADVFTKALEKKRFEK
ncbi:unnamed protein product, partial [Ascophyllum nodosum]